MNKAPPNSLLKKIRMRTSALCFGFLSTKVFTLFTFNIHILYITNAQTSTHRDAETESVYFDAVFV